MFHELAIAFVNFKVYLRRKCLSLLSSIYIYIVFSSYKLYSLL
jgi:hypothetical protein